MRPARVSTAQTLAHSTPAGAEGQAQSRAESATSQSRSAGTASRSRNSVRPTSLALAAYVADFAILVGTGEALLYLLEQHPVVILQSPTGTGKSTQLPQFLLEAGWAKDGKCIAVTQPRRCAAIRPILQNKAHSPISRVAAISVAQRVAEEVGCILGEEVRRSRAFSLNRLGTEG